MQEALQYEHGTNVLHCAFRCSVCLTACLCVCTGAGHGAAAKRATLVTVSTGFLLAVPIAAGLYAARTHWATLYTSDARVGGPYLVY